MKFERGVFMSILKAEHRFEAFLPRAACSQEVYDEVAKIALASGISKAELVRQAVEFFLPRIDQKSSDKGTKNVPKQRKTHKKSLAD
jgi:hypothetical protein